MSIDQHYTPEWLAGRMIARVRAASIKSVADFSAGDGVLLRASETRWPRAIRIAADLDCDSVSSLKHAHPNWRVSQCDFLSDRSRANAASLRGRKGQIDLILLNPPFSCRGAERLTVSVCDESVACSRALAFLATALQYLSNRGELIALMPINTLSSEKDRSAWNTIRRHYKVTQGEFSGRRDFEDCVVRCVVVRIRRGRSGVRLERATVQKATSRHRPLVSLVRGTVQMHNPGVGTRTLVHSTDLVSNAVILNGHIAPRERPSIVGPAVLVPRVGQPSKRKICLYLRRERVALSDCVIGIQCLSRDDAIRVQERLISSWKLLRRAYSGTCAQYTTLRRIEGCLVELGCSLDASRIQP